MRDFSQDSMFDMFPVKLIRETGKAMLLVYAGAEWWVPSSLIKVIRMDEEKNPTHIQVPEWFAKKEGFYE